MKRHIALLLALMIIFTFASPVFAEPGGEDPGVGVIPEIDLDDLDNTIKIIDDAIKNVPEIAADAAKASSLSDCFKSFITVVGPYGQILSAVNGTITFLKLIGVVEDSTTKELVKITEQLTAINDKLTDMDQKLNSISDAIARTHASVEINGRNNTAMHMNEAWRDFQYKYMETGLDSLMHEYDIMLTDGITEWCLNEGTARTMSGIDTSFIPVIYQKDRYGKWTVSVTISNTAPESPERGFVIYSDALPSSIEYNVGTCHDDIVAAIKASIVKTIKGEGGRIDFYGISGLTWDNDILISQLAEDAYTVLIYRIAAGKVNASSKFTKDVISAFSLYSQHLFDAQYGIDAVFNDFYFTHAFESQIKDDLTDFCNRMIIKTGTYGMFAANILGMSRYATDDDKLAAAKQLADSVQGIKDALDNGLTGRRQFSYITGTELWYTDVNFRATTGLKMEYVGGVRRYLSAEKVDIKSYIRSMPWDGWAYAGETTALVMLETLRYNGITPDGKYLSKTIGSGDEKDTGQMVVYYGEPQALSFDGSVLMKGWCCFGSYLPNSTFSRLPDKVGLSYVPYRSRLTGSVIDLSSGALATGQTVIAAAVYGERHWYWCFDEGGLMGGPADNPTYAEAHQSKDIPMKNMGANDVTYYRDLVVTTDYNLLLAVPYVGSALKSEETLCDPLSTFAALNESITSEWQDLYSHVPTFSDPGISTIDEVGLTEGLWGTNAPETDGIRDLIEVSLEKAGLPSEHLSDAEKDALAQKMKENADSAALMLERIEDLQTNDPFGIGQNDEKVFELAEKLVPEHLSTQNGSVPVQLSDAFVKLNIVPFTELTFENGEPVLRTGYSVEPYLIACAMTDEGNEVLSIPIPDDVLEEEVLEMTFRIPSGRREDGGTVNVRILSNDRNLTLYTEEEASVTGKYIELTVGPSAHAVIPDPEPEGPVTGVNSLSLLSWMILLMSALLIVSVRRNREKTA